MSLPTNVRQKAAEGSRTPRRFALFVSRAYLRQVVECGCRLPLWLRVLPRVTDAFNRILFLSACRVVMRFRGLVNPVYVQISLKDFAIEGRKPQFADVGVAFGITQFRGPKFDPPNRLADAPVRSEEHTSELQSHS